MSESSTLPVGESNENAHVSTPVARKERITSIDALRGFALLGILVMNIQSFAMVDVAYLNPTVAGPLTGSEFWVWALSHVLADQKFMTIFSLLFGAGTAMMAERQTAKGLSPAALHYRRLGWLLVFGLMHAYLIWHGDILVTYALCGSIVYLFRRLPPWALLLIGVISFSVASGIFWAAGYSVQFLPEEAVQELRESDWTPSAELIEQEIAAYRGSWLEQMPYRAQGAFYMQTFVFLILFGWRASGLMLMGMALYRWKVFSAERSTFFYCGLLSLGLLVGVPLISYGIVRNFSMDWNIEYSFFAGTQFNYWGSLLVSLGYVGLLMLCHKSLVVGRLLSPLAAVGQMALTNYLLHSIICTTIFYGNGFGQFAKFSRVEQIATVVMVWTFQLVVSPIWLRYFRSGPFEWLWRSLTYGRVQPLLREA